MKEQYLALVQYKWQQKDGEWTNVKKCRTFNDRYFDTLEEAKKAIEDVVNDKDPVLDFEVVATKIKKRTVSPWEVVG